MDILFFFTERTRFIRMFYEKTSSAFNDVVAAIEAAQPPYDSPPYDESGEPPFMREWVQADEGIEVVGLTCVSMLSASLQAYFLAWEREIAVEWAPNERNRVWRKGGLSGYVSAMEQALELPPGRCPADIEILEQATLARNAVQHPDRITDLIPQHRKRDLKRYPRPFFMSPSESLHLEAARADGRGDEGDLEDVSFLVPRVHVPREKLHRALAEADRLARWLDDQLVTH